MLDELTKSLTPRLMFLLLVAGVVLLLSAANAVWFKKQIKDYRQLSESYNTIKNHPADLDSAELIAKNLRKEISELDEQLSTVGREVLKGKPLSVIADLGRYAKQHQVQMVNIKPEAEVKGELYTEIPFNVSLLGSYEDLYKWVYTLENSNNPLFIKNFTLSSGSDKTTRTLQLAVGLIQPIEEK
ncbi:MAG: type 4a pilus biogenesis protein PilO [Gammaproteobacteria bacterium]